MRKSATAGTTLRASLTSSRPQPCGPTAPRTYLPWPLLIAIFMDWSLQGWGEEERSLGIALIDQLMDQLVLRCIARSGADIELVRGVGDCANEDDVHDDQGQSDRLGF